MHTNVFITVGPYALKCLYSPNGLLFVDSWDMAVENQAAKPEAGFIIGAALHRLHMHSFRYSSLKIFALGLGCATLKRRWLSCLRCQSVNELKLDQLVKHLRLIRCFGSSAVAISRPLITTWLLKCWVIFTFERGMVSWCCCT